MLFKMAEIIQTTTRAMLTKYPSIYKNVYWGWCTLKGHEIAVDSVRYSTPEIIENRNRFIEEHGITRLFKLPWCVCNSNIKWLTGVNQAPAFDHRECYLTNKNTVIILVSPYTDNYRDEILCNGFKETYPMYGNGAVSYYIEIPKKFSAKYLKTKELETYWEQPISELISPKKGLLYWMRVMRYEQLFFTRVGILGRTLDKNDVFVRAHDCVLDYMQIVGIESEPNWDNLYEFHKSQNSIRTELWVEAVCKA